MPKVRHILLLLPLAALVAWIAVRARDLRDDPADVLAALRAAAGPALPAAAAAGAEHRSEPEAYDRTSLYDYIDGAADAYLERGFQRCLVAAYSLPGGLEATAEVYRFADPAGALAQLEAERPAAAAPLSALAGAWSDGAVLLAARGPDYLKVAAFAAGDAREALVRIARAWAEAAR